MTNTSMNNVRTLPANETAFSFANPKLISETILDNTREIGGIRIGALPLELLFVDMSYQRPSHTKVKKIAAEFDLNKCGMILVSYRSDTGLFAIIDGSHRFEAARLIGMQTMVCQILTGLSVEQEALVFAAQNENCVRLTENDLLKAQVRAGDEIAIGFQNLCREFGIKLYACADTGALVCTKTARNYFTEDAEALRWVFAMISKVKWHAVRKGYSTYSVKALWSIYHDFRDRLPEVEDKLYEILTPLTPQMLVAKAVSVFPAHTKTEATISLLSCVLDGRLPRHLLEKTV